MLTLRAISTHAVQRPALAALVTEARTISWSELAERVARVAGGLVDLGVEVGDRIALLGENSPGYVETLFAAQWLGATVVPLNTRWVDDELRYVLDHAGVRLLGVDAAHSERVPGLRQAGRLPLGSIRIGRGDDARCTDVLAENGRRLALRESDGPLHERQRIASILYTGGTTGRSKGVALTFANHDLHSLLLAVSTGLTEHVRYLHAAPMFHIADGLYTQLVTLLGGTHVVLPRFTPAACLEALETHAITDTILVPTMVQRLLAEPESERHELPALRRLFYGASPMPEAVLRALIARWPHVEPIQLYGQSESSPVLTVLRGRDHVLHGDRACQLRSAGRPMSGTDVRIFDAADREVPRGVVGEIVARGPQVMAGYWADESESARALRGGWLHTGDAGYLDDEGFLYVTDRLKDMIITGGENVYSVEVENALYEHPGVAQCAVFGIPDESWGERVHAVVVPAPGSDVDEAALRTHCERVLASYKRPRSYTLRAEALPLSGAGKILKRELRAPHWVGRERSI